MMIGRTDWRVVLTPSTRCRTVVGAGWNLRDGMTAQRAAALGPVPV
jgi:hypothetical protein